MAKKETNNDMTKNIIIFVALLVAFVGGYVFARAKYKPQILELNKMVMERDNTMSAMKANANKIMMKDGKMWVIKDGVATQMANDTIMKNGTKVMMNGKMMQDGKEVDLRNGDSLDMEGKMMTQKSTIPSY